MAAVFAESRKGAIVRAGRGLVLTTLLLLTMRILSPPAQAQGAITQPRMQIYAGPLHREYLGCLNCDRYDVNSVWNDFGPFGWDNGYPNASRFATYRLPHGRYSACDPFASDPPILLDTSGKDYGRLNISMKRADSICGPHGAPSICETLKTMCQRNQEPRQ
ncbi:hypothetical protein [Telmatospirillum sp.]|uniref:hypothetical protein n=1 Tax=Telmatospirillum sp. TaxID=2079197 RepID=UPI00283D2488|nr:hypothetical protein [Telmatospirillum sp.]MDR3439114.1 hypothetical protein [Telmatospirillum sp.]